MEQTLHATPFSSTQLSEPDSVSPEEIAAFLDGSIAGQDRARVEAYFADNPDARRELIEASRIVATLPRRPVSRSWFVPAAAVAAAAVIAIVLATPGNSNREATRVAERRGAAQPTQTVELIAPAKGEELGITEPFVWKSIEGASYTIFVLDPAGRTILQESTTDTVYSVPALVLKQSPGRYYWSVDAQMPDGSSTTSGSQEFVVSHR